jgi:penicillin amidase
MAALAAAVLAWGGSVNNTPNNPQARAQPTNTIAVEELRTQALAALAKTSGELTIAGLSKPVEILRDTWGVPHIYAKTQDDLFFAQGFVVAQDRLWQLDLWRRKAMGELAEIMGPEAVERDRFARLLRYRGDWRAEWLSYSVDTKPIVESFVRGINAYIASIGDNLPVEFKLTGTRPGLWTPEVVVSRMAAYPMTGNASRELLRAMVVRELGAERTAQLFPTDPARIPRPEEGLSLEGMDTNIIAGLERAAGEVSFDGDAPSGAANSASACGSKQRAARSLLIRGLTPWATILSPLRGCNDSKEQIELASADDWAFSEGSNNWTIAGVKTKSWKPILANDPHRALLLPSLRYIVHLVGPGWDVIGAGEPALPGVSIGHNQRIAFGLTIFAADQQDIVVERTKEDDPGEYFDHTATVTGGWTKLEIVDEEIPVKGEAPRKVQLKFTHHGPVIFEDAPRHRLYVLRWVGTQPGTAGYLAGLAISRAKNWLEFREGLKRWRLPPENFVYADVDGNIGYQAAGLVPARACDGLLPVRGDAKRCDWRGFLRLIELPNEYNPAQKFLATANNNTLAANDKHLIGFEWSSDYRVGRIREVLAAAQEVTVADSERLQADVTSLPARELLPLVARIPPGDAKRAQAVELLKKWDAKMEMDSPSAAIFEAWLGRLRTKVYRPLVPEQAWRTASRLISLPAMIRGLRDADALLFPTKKDGGLSSDEQRNQALAQALDEAIAELERRLGPDMTKWRWGALHTASFTHPLASAKDAARGQAFSLGPVERGGDGNTVNATAGTNYTQSAGASFRQVMDLANWDRSTATNTPGQSGQPGSVNYDDLLTLWAREEHFPLSYSRAAVDKNTKSRLRLVPKP